MVDTLESLLAANKQGKCSFSASVILPVRTGALTAERAALCHAVVILYEISAYVQNRAHD